MSKFNKLNKIIPLSFISLTLISIAGVSMSLAWYSTGRTAQISNIGMRLSGEPDLKIGLEDSEGNVVYYENTVPSSAFLNYTGEYEPVSSMYSSLFLDQKSDVPIFRNRYTTTGNISSPSSYHEGNVATSGFYQIPIYLYSERDIYVTLDKEGTTFEADTEVNRKKAQGLTNLYTEKSEDEIYENLNNVIYSLRYSLLDTDSDTYSYTIIDPFKEEDTYYSGILDVNDNDYYDVYFKDSSYYELLYGEYEGEVAYSYSSNEIDTSGELDIFNAKHQADTYLVDLENSTSLIRAKEESVTPEELENNMYWIPLNHHEEKKFIFSIYLEGWDLDNINSMEYGAFIASMKFKVTREKI